MVSNRLAFLGVAMACVGAAAGGGYLATRQNTVPTPASAQVQPVPASTPAPVRSVAPAPAADATASSPSKAVQKTDGIVSDAPRTPAPAAKIAAAKPAEPPPAHPTSARASRPAAPLAHHETAPTISSENPASPIPAPSTPRMADNVATAPRPEDHAVPEPTRPIEPPAHTFAEYVVSADSVIGLQTEARVSSESARVEDRVDARVTRDVKVGDHVAIPAGARAIGSVMQVERGGKFKERAHLGIRFHTLVLADGTRIPISTETIFREGDPPGNSSPSKVGGAAVGGAILGAILGGAKGMAIGAAAGAGAGTAVVAAGERNAATFPAGTPMTVRILQPVTVSVERD